MCDFSGGAFGNMSTLGNTLGVGEPVAPTPYGSGDNWGNILGRPAVKKAAPSVGAHPKKKSGTDSFDVSPRPLYVPLEK